MFREARERERNGNVRQRLNERRTFRNPSSLPELRFKPLAVTRSSGSLPRFLQSASNLIRGLRQRFAVNTTDVANGQRGSGKHSISIRRFPLSNTENFFSTIRIKIRCKKISIIHGSSKDNFSCEKTVDFRKRFVDGRMVIRKMFRVRICIDKRFRDSCNHAVKIHRMIVCFRQFRSALLRNSRDGIPFLLALL